MGNGNSGKGIVGHQNNVLGKSDRDKLTDDDLEQLIKLKELIIDGKLMEQFKKDEEKARRLDKEVLEIAQKNIETISDAFGKCESDECRKFLADQIVKITESYLKTASELNKSNNSARTTGMIINGAAIVLARVGPAIVERIFSDKKKPNISENGGE